MRRRGQIQYLPLWKGRDNEEDANVDNQKENRKSLKLATKLLKTGDKLLRPAKAKARRGEQLGDYERQLGASGGSRYVRRAPGPGEIKGTCAPKGSTR